MARRGSATALVLLVAVCGVAIHTVAALSSAMPYRPGYGLGSWVPASVVDSMRNEAAKRAEIFTINGMDAEARGLEREVRMAQSADGDEAAVLNETQAAAILNDIRSARQELWSKKAGIVKSWLKDLTKEVKETAERRESGNAGGGFSTFGRSYESPVNWASSTTARQDRSFDSINIGVHYVRNERMEQEGDGRSHAMEVLASLSNQTHSVTGRTTDMQREAARMASDKTQRIATTHKVTGTLLVSAFATHRMVQQFNTLAINVDNLWRGWNYLNPTDVIADPLNQKDTFKKELSVEAARDPANATRASIVSEMFLGSVLVGMVHFVQTQKTNASINDTLARNARKFNEDIEENVRQAQKLASLVGSSTIAVDEARRMAKLGSESGLDVQFDLVAIGHIPQLASNPIQQTVSQFANFDPANFRVPSMLDSGTPISTAAALVQSNMAAVIAATVGAVAATAPSSEAALTSGSFMDAFSDFVKAAQAGNAVGAPIGMNVAQFTKLDVMSQLANKYLNTGINLGVDV